MGRRYIIHRKDVANVSNSKQCVRMMIDRARSTWWDVAQNGFDNKFDHTFRSTSPWYTIPANILNHNLMVSWIWTRYRETTWIRKYFVLNSQIKNKSFSYRRETACHAAPVSERAGGTPALSKIFTPPASSSSSSSSWDKGPLFHFS